MARISRQVSVVDSSGDHQRMISCTEAKKMCSTGETLEICRQCGRHGESLQGRKFCGANQRAHQVVYMLTKLHRNIHRSSVNLGFTEMLANVGLSKRDERDHPISAAFENMVREKVKAWPLCHDTKAPMVAPRV